MNGRVGIDIRNVPPRLVRAVEREAKRENRSVTDTIVARLATRYALDVESTGYPYSGASGSTHWNLRVPARLHEVLKAQAKALGGATIAGCLLHALADEYGLPAISPRKRVPTRLDPKVIARAKVRHARGESIRSISRALGVKRETLTRAIRN